MHSDISYSFHFFKLECNNCCGSYMFNKDHYNQYYVCSTLTTFLSSAFFPLILFWQDTSLHFDGTLCTVWTIVDSWSYKAIIWIFCLFRYVYACMYLCIYVCNNICMCVSMFVCVHVCMYRWVDGYMDGWMDGWIDGLMNG